MTAVETVTTYCPCCGTRVTSATCVEDQPAFPRRGDVSICFKCRAVNVYADNIGNLRHPTLEESKEILADARVTNALAALMTSNPQAGAE
jgi:hypothetical protein